MSRGVRSVVLAAGVLALAGCGAEVDSSYGRVRSRSLNGTGVLAGLFREGGHEVRPAVRLNDPLGEWADVIVRFAPAPGPPPKAEAAWYDTWLSSAPGRTLVYVPRDYDATEEYWNRVLAGLPAGAPPRLRERAEEARSRASGWPYQLPESPKEVASPAGWFAVETGQAAEVCRRLSGPWAAGLDTGAAALTRHETLKTHAGRVLLSGDGKPLVAAWSNAEGGRVLVAAGGPFLLNLPLVEPARRPLARRVVDWAVEGDDDENEGPRPKHVAFVEGPFVLAHRSAPPSVFSLLKVSPFGRVTAQLLALGLAACLARAPRLGRPRLEDRSDADRPVAHPEALGALLARTRQAGEARSVLAAYRRWRHPSPGRRP